MLESFNRAAFCLMASVGHRLGLFDVMQQMPLRPLTRSLAAPGSTSDTSGNGLAP